MEESQENDKILMVWKKIRKFLSNVTLEPIMFLWSIAFPMQMVRTKQLVIGAQKISKIKFFNKSPEYKQYRDLLSPLSFKAINNICECSDKTCLNDFHYSPEICDNLVKNKTLNSIVQNEVAQFEVYEHIVDHTTTFFVLLFMGSWSDRLGRKYIFYYFFLFTIMGEG